MESGVNTVKNDDGEDVPFVPGTNYDVPPVGVMPGCVAVGACEYGSGSLILFSPHPELDVSGPNKESGKAVLVRASFAVSSRGPRGGPGGREKAGVSCELHASTPRTETN